MELSLKGTRISPGLASGTVWLAGDILDCSAEIHRIEPHQVEAEMERIRRAFGFIGLVSEFRIDLLPISNSRTAAENAGPPTSHRETSLQQTNPVE
jgi:hypothetical protein